MGVSPSAAAFSSLMMSIAAAPSVICELLAAVTRPSSLNDGLSVASFSTVDSRMPSSVVIDVPSASSTGRISRSKRPSSRARAA